MRERETYVFDRDEIEVNKKMDLGSSQRVRGFEEWIDEVKVERKRR